MPQHLNPFNQPIGLDVPNWQAAVAPDQSPLQGRYCRLVALDPSHSADLFEAFSSGDTDGLWTYMPVGPFETLLDLQEWVTGASISQDPLFYALIEQSTGKAVGVASYLRITPAQGVIEVGFISFSPRLQRTTVATEVMFLMMQYAFNTLGNRRYEWKCDALNAPSRAAAQRYGFTYDGLFKQAMIYKGRNRDTAWYSILDGDWPAIERGFTTWLDPANFDADGQQKQRLADLITAQGGASAPQA